MRESLLWSGEGRLPRLQARRGESAGTRTLDPRPLQAREVGLTFPLHGLWCFRQSHWMEEDCRLLPWPFVGNGQHVCNVSLGPSAAHRLGQRDGLARSPFPEQRPTHHWLHTGPVTCQIGLKYRSQPRVLLGFILSNLGFPD